MKYNSLDHPERFRTQSVSFEAIHELHYTPKNNTMKPEMCKPQPVQLDCREEKCKHHVDANCTHPFPALSGGGSGRFTHPSKDPHPS